MVRIITDSAADFEPDELRDLGICCASMQVCFGDDEYKENENLTKELFYDLLKNSPDFPKTSQPTPFDFENLLADFKDSGDECVIITISSALSGTYQNASLVKEMLDYEDCYVVDSLSATGGERLLVEQAVKMRDSGKSAKEIGDTLENLKGRIRLYACLDTLEYLHKGGRLSKAAYTVGTLANIKPLITLSIDGKVEVMAKAMSIKSGISNVCKKLTEEEPDTDYPMYIVYSHDSKNAETLSDKVKKYGYEVDSKNIINIGAAIGAHVGTGACGIIYIAK